MQNIQTLNTVDAIWTIIQSQSKAVRKALAKRLNEAEAKEVQEKRMRTYAASLSQEQREKAYSVAKSVSLALKDAKATKRENHKLPDAHDLFKIMDEEDA